MGVVKRNDALAKTKLRSERVEVPEWGDGAYVFVRVLTGNERDSWETYCLEQRKRYRSDTGFPGFRASLLVRCLVDNEGERIFLDTDVDELGAKPASLLDRLFTVATRINAVTADDIEELKKN